MRGIEDLFNKNLFNNILPNKALLLISFLIMVLMFSFASGQVTHVKNDNPTVNMTFDVDVEITHSTLEGENIDFEPSGMSDQFIYQSSLTDEGAYCFDIRVRNEDNIGFENETFPFCFKLDKTAPTISYSIPGQGESLLLDEGEFEFKLAFDEAVNPDTFLWALYRDGIKVQTDAEEEFNENNQVLLPINLSENGNYEFRFSVEDLAGNKLEDSVEFELMFNLDVYLHNPPQPYLSTTNFDLSFRTNMEAECGFRYDGIGMLNLGDLTDNDFSAFSESDGIIHSHSDFSAANGDTVKIFLLCSPTENTEYPDRRKEFTLNVDSTPPRISVIASDVTSMPLVSNVIIELDDESICKWSDSELPFSEMYYISGANSSTEYQDYFTIKARVEDNKNYKYYITCVNRAGLNSSKTVNFKTNTNVDLKITLNHPSKKYYGINLFPINATTNKNSICSYHVSEGGDIDKDSIVTKSGSFGTPTLEHISGNTHFALGSNKVYVKCESSTSTGKVDSIVSAEFFVDTSAPKASSVKIIKEDEKSSYIWVSELIEVEGVAEDAESGIDTYFFSINSSKNSNHTYSTGWIPSTKPKFSITGDVDGKPLALKNGGRYFVSMIVRNNAGLFSKEVKTIDFIFDESKKPLSCSNNKLDENETDVDCGGSCGPCAIGKSCVISKDCASIYCSDKICKESSCYDGIKNGEESDVDCGGKCQTCPSGKKCNANSDCLDNNCKNGVCFVADPCSNLKLDDGEADTDCGGVCEKKCLNYNTCTQDSDCSSSNCEEGICKKKEDVEKPNPNDLDPLDDEDGDGIPNGWELLNGLDPFDSMDARTINSEGITYLEQYENEISGNNKKSSGEGSSWWIWLLFLLLLIIILIVGFFEFVNYKRKKGEKVNLPPWLDNLTRKYSEFRDNLDRKLSGIISGISAPKNNTKKSVSGSQRAVSMINAKQSFQGRGQPNISQAPQGRNSPVGNTNDPDVKHLMVHSVENTRASPAMQNSNNDKLQKMKFWSNQEKKKSERMNIINNFENNSESAQKPAGALSPADAKKEQERQNILKKLEERKKIRDSLSK